MTAQIEIVDSKTALRRRSSRKRNPMVAVVAAALSAVLVASTFIAMAGTASPADAAGASDGSVKGTVFQTFTSSGWLQRPGVGESDVRPVAGVTATAYDAQGNVAGSAVSNAKGGYTIVVDEAYSKALRVEFSGWAAPLEPAFAAQGTPLPEHISSNNTSVRFVTLGADNLASGVDFGLIVPEHTAQKNAPIASSAQSAGSRTALSRTRNSIVAQPWSAEGEIDKNGKLPASVSKLATFGQTGSVWGMAYAPRSNDLFAAATLKRMSDFGPLGIGGIYRTADMVKSDGTVNTKALTSPLFSFEDLPVSNVSNAGNTGNVLLELGDDFPTGRDLEGPRVPKREIRAFAQTGRVGLGAIATSPDATRLFATNLHDGQVYAVDISTRGVKPTSAYRIATPVNETQAIWAIEVHEGRMYIGYVDTGDSAANVPAPGASAKDKQMKAYVASTPIAGVLDAPAAAPEWTRELTVDLGYAKGSNIANWDAEGGGKFEQRFPQLKRWNSWTDTWNWGAGKDAGTVGLMGPKDYNNLHGYPQAILSSIAFDADGYLNLGFLDRTSLQSGNRSFSALPEVPKGANTELWTTISNGDILVAAPSARWEAAGTGCPTQQPLENYVLECKGKVGDRQVRTATDTVGKQIPTFDNMQGPGGGEFFNDRRNLGAELGLGTQENHNENALGAVTAYPGSREVSSTTMDPRSKAYINGLMWFDRGDGRASRGIDLVEGTGGATGDESFQKSGGMGATALLALEAPVEIGNRVWLDADLNGRQDADEPAINGAVVELWTAGATGQPETKMATRTTATVNGQPGTYYFRSDDADLVPSATQKNPFVANGSYVLVFKAGSGAVDLKGPNNTHRGFDGLNWADLQLTSAEVRVAPTETNGGTDEANDSNPDVTTGQFPITVGGPGQNDHTYDAGWFATNGYELSKAFNPSNVVIPDGTNYTFDVVSAQNFRGENRLRAGGPSIPGDPQVAEAEIVLGSPSWKHSSTKTLPLGYTLVLAERGASAGSVTWSTPVSDNPDRGQVTIVPKRTAEPVAQLKATNRFGSFEVIKTVTGTAASAVGDDVKFTLEYSRDGGTTVETGSMTKATPFKLGSLPLDTTVRFREPTPIETDPVLEGITWGTPTWTQVPGLSGPDGDGWYSYTITAAKPTISLSLRNTADTTLGGFSILKQRADEKIVASGQKFSFQYKVGAAGTPITLGPIAADATVSSQQTIVYGSTVMVREITPPDLGNAKWQVPSWSGLPADAVGPDANGWYSFTFKPTTTAPLEFTVLNTAIPQYGTFNVSKTVDGTGAADAAGDAFTFWYRTAPPVDSGAPVFGPEQSFELQNGATWQGPAALLVGTLVEVREEQPANTADVSWQTPSWSLDGSAASVVGGRIQFPITAGAEGAARAVVATNHADKLHGLTLRKAFLGAGVDQVVGKDFVVDVKIAGRSDEVVTLKGDGTAWQGPTDLLEGTVVMVKEQTPPTVTGIAWGDPIWTDGNGSVLQPDLDGWSSFTIGDEATSAALTVTNTPSILGQFQVKKTLIKTGAPEVPVNYTIKYTLDDAPEETITLKAEETSAVVADLPIGTEVKVREVAPTPGVNGTWASPVWTVNGAPAEIEDGWVTFTITDGALVVFEVENSIIEKHGKFQVAKTISGTSANKVPGDTKFWFKYTLDDGMPQLISATPDTISAVVDHLPHGTRVTIEEVAFPEIPGIAFDESPGWKINGVAVDADKVAPLSFTIDVNQTQLVELSVDNTAEPEYGRFDLTKAITGAAADRVPDDASFEVQYSIDGGVTWVDMDPITKRHLTVSSGDILVGTNVKVRERAPADGVDFEWGNPEFAVDGTNQGTSAQFTINVAGASAKVLHLKNPALPLDATFSVQKRLTGDFALNDPQLATRSFTAVWSVNKDLHGTIVLNKANNWKASPAEGPFPTGTVVTLTEGPVTGLPASVQNNGYTWLTGVPGVTVSADGRTATLVVGSGQPTPLVLTNDLTKLGTFEVEKLIEGDFTRTDPEFADLEFTANWSGGGRSGSIALNAENEWKGEPGGDLFAKGTAITLTEAEVSGLPPHVSFGGHSWLGSVPGVTVSEDGETATLIVDGGPPALLTLENAFELEEGSFEVEKLIAGDFERTDPEFADLEFTAHWAGGGRSGSIVLSAANDWKGGPAGADFPVGTTITLTEGAVTGLPAHVQHTGHRWLAGVAGVSVSSDGQTATLVVQKGEPALLQLENSTTELTGSFVVEKELEGDFTLSDPEFADVEFTANWSGAGRNGEIKLNAGNGWKGGPTGAAFPKGTRITLTEGAVTGLPPHAQFDRYDWVKGVPGVTVSADGLTATLLVQENAPENPVKLTLVNTIDRLTGSFRVEKRIDGDFTRTDPEFADLEFTANWSGGGRSGAIVLNADNGWEGGPGGGAFPKGTVITLTEGAVTGLPANVEFDRYSWLTGVAGVTVSADGRTATVTVDSGTPARLTLKNTFTELEGTFGIEKIVDGPFALSDEELKDLTFLAQYTASTGTSGTLALNADGRWKADAGRQFPAGTTISLTEVAVDQAVLPPNVKWEGYRWQPADGYTVSADGQTASLIVGDGTNVALSLRNSFTELEGAFSVQKLLAGDFTLTDPELRGQSFTVAYSATNGVKGTLDLSAANGWTAAAGKLPAGTVVTLTELAPKKLASNVGWTGHRWLPAPGLTVSTDGKSATLTVSAQAPIARLSLRNTLTELDGSFSVEKVVAGDFALDGAELSGLTFAVPYTASNGAEGTLALNKAGEWTAQPGEEFPVGTVITLTEAEVTGLPAHVKWSGYSWLDGKGYTVSDDGATASFTIADESTQPKLTLQNSFSKVSGGFTLTKQVTGVAAERVPGDLEFTAEYSLDGGSSWNALPAVTKDNPFSAGPRDVPLGTTVLIREIAPAAVPGVAWGAPAFSGTGVKPGIAGEPSSFVVGSSETPVQVLLSNPTTPSNGQFQVTKKITGAGASLLKGDPVFTVKYSYQAQQGAGEFTIKAGELASSEPIPSGTVVTITEVAARGGLVEGASWGTAVFVLADGTVLQNGASITIGADSLIELQLENPTRPPLPPTGFDGLAAGVSLSILLGAGGLLFLLFGGRRRRRGAHRG